MAARRSGTARRRLILVLGTLALSLIGVEVAMRLFWPVKYLRPNRRVRDEEFTQLLHRSSDVPGLNYELAPDRSQKHKGVLIETNSRGMRDDEVLVDPPESSVRILALGDSVTFGWGVPGDATWPNVLEALLSANPVREGSSYEVLNMGVSGFSSRDEAAALRGIGMLLDPEIVIVAYFLNDPEIEPFDSLQVFFREPDWWQYSHLLRRLARIKKVRDQERFGGSDNDYFRYLHAPGETKWKTVVRAFEDIHGMTEAADVRALLVIFPSLKRKKSWDDYEYADLHAQVEAAALESGLEVLNLLPVYRASGLSPQRIRVDNWHPNVAGHRIAAEAIAARLRGDP